MSIAKIITPSGATVIITGRQPFSMARSHKLFDDLIDAIRQDDEEEILNIIDIANKVVTYTAGEVAVIDGQIFYGDEQVTGVLVDRIFEHMAEGIDASHLLLFLKNLMQNESKQSREELYLFLENATDMPITEDGRFIAYKWVTTDYKDCHTRTFDNSVGQIVKMPRRNVNDDRRQTCSSGLHVCSRNYDRFGQRLMLVAVNPKDVVSVPNDYNNAKMRVCEYEVIAEIDDSEYENKFTNKIYSTKVNEEDDNDFDFGEDDDLDDYGYNKDGN